MKYCNMLRNLVEVEAQVSMLEEAYAALIQAYKDLNKSHENYAEIVEENIIGTEGDLEGPFRIYSNA